MLDELDSGLDIDALRACAKRIEELTQPDGDGSPGLGVLAITHYSRLLTELHPDTVHILVKGRIVASGGPELADELEADGYAAFESDERRRGRSRTRLGQAPSTTSSASDAPIWAGSVPYTARFRPEVDLARIPPRWGVRTLLGMTDTWTETDGALHRRFEFADFSEAFAFMTRVALLAEKAGHHPDWSNSWNKVDISLTTHSAGSTVTDNDRNLAAAIDKLLA